VAAESRPDSGVGEVTRRHSRRVGARIPQKWGLTSVRLAADDLQEMQKLNAKDLAEHVEQLEKASVEELDELLTDLLVQVYPTKNTQDS
jgi:hypothetical protein